MKILLDTQTLLWSLYQGNKLPERIASLIQSESNIVYYSLISLWEIELKHSLHPEYLAYSSKDVGRDLEQGNYSELGLKALHIFTISRLTKIADTPKHNDPFDHLLMAQAKSEDIILLTTDSKMRYYDEKCIMVYNAL